MRPDPLNVEAERLVELLELVPHPEGGYFRETFRAPRRLGAHPGEPGRHASTAIYFLLTADTFSAFHAVSGADEIWHHYLGDPVEIHVIGDDGRHAMSVLGTGIADGERPQVIVPSGTLQAAIPRGSTFALCGCTVAPGFDFADFALPPRAELLGRFPQHREVIERLTRG